ncbi:periplasmic copper chaperone A [Azospirillaceae bacterium]
MKKWLVSFVMLISLAFLADSVSAQEAKVGAIVIKNPWSRETAASMSTAVAYMILQNEGKDADRLLSGATPVADRVEIHTHVDDNGVMKMRQIPNVELAPGSVTTFAPGGLHVMLFGVKAPLKKGVNFPLTLTFEKAGAVTLDVAVQGGGDGHFNASVQKENAKHHEHDEREGHHDHGSNH